jgi:AraC-like DNA-binding protein
MRVSCLRFAPAMSQSNLTSWEGLARQSEYRPAMMARLCGVSLRTLQRHFRDKHDLCVGSWMRSVRLDEAFNRIKAGEPIKVVALELGYKQLSHFSRAFKQAYGAAPTHLTGRVPRSLDLPAPNRTSSVFKAVTPPQLNPPSAPVCLPVGRDRQIPPSFETFESAAVKNDFLQLPPANLTRP